MALLRGGLALALLAAALAHSAEKAHNHTSRGNRTATHEEHHHKGSKRHDSEHTEMTELPTVELPSMASASLLAPAPAPEVATPTLPAPATLPPMPSIPPLPTLPAWDEFDCFTGYDNWQLGWSDAQKEWCCKHKELGCATTTMPEFECKADDDVKGWSEAKRTWCCENEELGCQHGTDPFDCLQGFKSWKEDWSALQQDWCCRHKGFGCKHPSDAAKAEGSQGLPYDCDEGARHHWSEEKKVWCCAYTDKGCPTTSTTTTEEPTTTTTNLGCKETCTVDGVEATCVAHIQQSSIADFLGDPDACTSAHEAIVKRCPQCQVCTLHEAGCGVLEGPTTTTTPPPTTTPPKGCWKVCPLDGVIADCRSRVQWSAEHLFGWKPNACRKAYDLVMGQCDPCADCTIDDTGCQEKNPNPEKEDPFDCDAGIANWEKGWSDGKKDWCCKHKDKGCKEEEEEEEVFKKFDQTALRKTSQAAGREPARAVGAVAGCGLLGLVALAAVLARRTRHARDYGVLPDMALRPVLE